ncbi:MAG: restriction endonuclease [Candidatus Thiodiazotropha sp. (ex Notomyrtea botanica)]|nr:restriction endonuclease [Candidatus Thiodiazotropha sp. (ex Notomyrtea botanica)]
MEHLAGKVFYGNAAAILGGEYKDHGKELKLCATCGWWIVTQLTGYMYGSYEGSIAIRRACGALCNFDVKDLSVPIEELRSYLLAKYPDRNQINPRKLEDVVAGVFSDFGYHVVQTPYTRDKGIDLYILNSKGGELAGVQVKRYTGMIEAEQIRAFVGALFNRGLTSGIYITTSGYRKGAFQEAAVSTARGIAVELWDADAFYEQMSISQKKIYQSIDDPETPFYQVWRQIEKAPISFQRSF